MLNRRSTSFAAAALLAFSAGCSLDSATAPDVAPSDLGQVLKEMSLSGLDGLLADLAPVDGSTIAITSSSGCSYAAASQSFVCPTAVVQGLRMTQSYTLYDASGVPQSQFGPTTTASVRTNQTVSGTLVEPGSTMKIDEQQQLTLSGLLTGHHVLNGSSTGHEVGTESIGAAVDSVDLTTTTTIANLALPPSGSAGTYPLSGTITIDMSFKDGSSAALTMRIEMTFNGTSKVSVVTSGSVGGQRCTVDLASSAPSCI